MYDALYNIKRMSKYILCNHILHKIYEDNIVPNAQKCHLYYGTCNKHAYAKSECKYITKHIHYIFNPIQNNI